MRHSSLRGTLLCVLGVFALSSCATTTSPQPLAERSLTAHVIYTPGRDIPADQFDISITFDSEHFPAASETFSCAGSSLERITGPSGWVSWTGHYPFDPTARASAAPLVCQYQGQGTTFTFSLDRPDVVQFTAPPSGATISLDHSTLAQYTVSCDAASVTLTASPALDVPPQVPPDQQPGATLGTQTGSAQVTLTPQMLKNVRKGAGLLKASSQFTGLLSIAGVRTATAQYITTATLAVVWE